MADSEHLVITPPDRFWGEALSVFLLDWPPDMTETLIKIIRGHQEPKLVIYLQSDVSNFEWMLNVAAASDIVIANLGSIGASDIVKGTLLVKPNCYYFGRPDLKEMFKNYIDDPHGKVLSFISTYTQKRN